MPLVLSSKAELDSAWRKYPDSDVEFLVQPLSGQASENFDKRNMHNEWEKGNPLPQRNDDYEINRACLIIKDWKNVSDENGKEVKCNEFSILNLHNHFPRIISWSLKQESLMQEGDAAILIEEKKI